MSKSKDFIDSFTGDKSSILVIVTHPEYFDLEHELYSSENYFGISEIKLNDRESVVLATYKDVPVWAVMPSYDLSHVTARQLIDLRM